MTGHRAGDNPHRWYFPGDVQRVIDQITADYQRLDPAHAAYFEQQKRQLENVTLKAYHDELAEIAARYAGTPVGASESIFVGLAQATKLDLVTPPSFLNAISEGSDVTAGDKATVDRQITDGIIKVYVFNSQNATPDITRLVDVARAHHIPVTTITETLPTGTTFQDWQVAQLRALQSALHTATGR